MADFSVSESNGAATSIVTGSLASGGGFQILGVDFAGRSNANAGPGAAFKGIFGTLHLGADGSFTYVLDNADTDTNLIGAGESSAERFTYTYMQNGVVHTGRLVFNIAGVDEAGGTVHTQGGQLSHTGNMTVAADERYVFPAGRGFLVTSTGDGALFQIDGAVHVGGPAVSEAVGVWAEATGFRNGTSVLNNGRVDVQASMSGQNANGVVVYTFGLTVSLVNNGVIQVHHTGTGTEYMVAASGVHGAVITNNGLIEAISDHGVAGAVGLDQFNVALVNNGVIRAIGNSDDVDPLGIAGVSGFGTRQLIDNRGTIEAVSTNPAGHTVGIYLYPDNTNVYQTGVILNSGRIVADTAIWAAEGHNVALTITNTGYIEGKLYRTGGLDMITNAAGASWIGDFDLGYFADFVRNAGSITGSVAFDDGADLFDGRGGSVSGTVHGDAGSDILLGGNAADRLDGGAEGDWIEGGAGADQLTGGAGADVFVYSGLNDSTAVSRDTITDFQTGVDRIDLSRLAPASVTITLSAGQTIVAGEGASGPFSIAVNGTVVLADIVMGPAPAGTIEGGAGNDTMRGGDAGQTLNGNNGNDTLYGDAGNDVINGGAGGDTMYGGAGDDSYYVDSQEDRLIEAQDGGHDTLWSWADYSMQWWIEDAYLGGSDWIGMLGNDLDNRITGNSAGNWLQGAGGNDVLVGGGGADELEGGKGADRFVYLLASDAPATGQVEYLRGFEHGADKIDLTSIVATAFDWDVFDNYWTGSYWTTVTITTDTGETMRIRVDGRATFADFIFANAQYGGGGGDQLSAGNQAGFLFGNGGNDVLIGSAAADLFDGGAGDDSMYGGAGNDSYYADSAGDLTFEDAGGGTDTVHASAGYYLYANVENLVLDPEAGDIFGVGNALANRITGNDGANLLIAGGGDDLVEGGAGNDAIFGEDGADEVIAGDGIDYLVGGGGADFIDGGNQPDAIYGGDGADLLVGGGDWATDILIGENGDDILDGDSSQGDYDRLNGGAGDDIYYVDTGDDLTFEAADGGTDTVYANVIGTDNGVYLYANVENLVLLNTTRFGVGNELGNAMTGSAIGNWLLGGAGADVLNGKQGNDVLFGEAGADRFVFEAGTGGDVIGDFAAGTDKIDLSAFFSSFAQVQANMVENGGTTAINLGGGNLVVLNGVANSALSAGDFILAGSSPLVAEARTSAASALDAGPGSLDPQGFIAFPVRGLLPIELFL